MSRRCLLAVLCGALALGAALPAVAGASGGALAISQVRPVTSDGNPAFVSVVNRSPQNVNPSGLSLQWRGAAGSSWQTVATLSSADMPPGRSFLVAFGDPRNDPAPANADQLSLGLYIANAGTLALVQGDVLLGCTTSADCANDTRVADMVAYGNVPLAEGTALAASASAPPGGIARKLGGCLDTGNNANDLEAPGSLTPVTFQSGTVVDCAGNQTAGPTAACGAGRLNVGAGKTGARAVSGTDPDDRVVDFAVSLAPNGTATVSKVTASAAAGAAGTAEIEIPETEAPGTYTATVTVSSGGAGLQKATCTFPITVATAAATSGTTTTRCTVPNVRNLTLAKARSRLKAKGCVAGKVKKPKGSSKGLVVRKQSRKAGSKVKRGTKVNLTLARKKKK